MNKLVVGKYVNTHGIKGEIRIKSYVEKRDKIYKVGNEIIIDKPYIITSYRVHKDFDMVTLEGITDISQIEHLKNSLVYIDRDKTLDKDDILDRDLIGFNIKNNSIDSYVTDICYLKHDKKLLQSNNRYIPFELIDHIDKVNKIIYIKEVIGL